MSIFAGSTPTVLVSVENVFSGVRYPEAGETPAVVDTGFEGFLGVPGSLFERLGLALPHPRERTLVTADGKEIPTQGAFARLAFPSSRTVLEGLVETWPGLDEVLLGTEALRAFRVELDYCIRRISMTKCRSVARP